MQKYHDEPKQYKGYLKSALVARSFLGDFPAFMAPVYSLVSPAEVPLYFLMGTFDRCRGDCLRPVAVLVGGCVYHLAFP